MAKNTNRTSFTKATIHKDEKTGRYTIEEITKDSAITYNLTEVLDRYAGVPNISLSFVSDADIDPVGIEE